MSWFNNLAETYDNCKDIWGVSDNNENILPPPYFLFKNIGKQKDSNGILIVLDKNGVFALPPEPFSGSVIIPYTPEAEARTSTTSAPYPLHEQLKYLAYYDKYYDDYMEQLSKWRKFHEKVNIVHEYLSKKTILDDLEKYDIKNLSSKTFVMFSVWAGDNTDLWKDNTVVDAWTKYCKDNESSDFGLCYVSGEKKRISKYSLKIMGNSKLICLPSDKEDFSFVYSGRFRPIIESSNDARIIDKEANHAAHSMLKYLIAKQVHNKCDSQSVVAWDISSGTAAVSPFEDSLGLCEQIDESQKSDSDKLIKAAGILDANYSKILCNALLSAGNYKRLAEHKNKIAVLVVDAATVGRMAVTFYKELQEDEYLENVSNWHETCCWHFNDKERSYITAPHANKIIAAVYGEPKGDGYNKIKKQGRERILNYIFSAC